jgi:hypothetical protein
VSTYLTRDFIFREICKSVHHWRNILVKICHNMTQRCFMLCTTYTSFWSIICPLEVRCLTPLSKIFHLLLLWRKLEYPEKSIPSISIKQLPFILTELEPSWSYGSWIYNYLCNHCLSPLKLRVWTPFMARCTRVDYRHNVRHIGTIPFLLSLDWDGWPLNSHKIFINYIKFPLLRPNCLEYCFFSIYSSEARKQYDE